MQKIIKKTKTTNEWLEFISQLGLVSISDARQVFLSGDYTQLIDLSQKALYTAGRGKALSLEGNLIGSKMTFDEAQLLAETRNAEQGFAVKDEVLAYINYERAVFYEKYGESFNSLSLFRSAKRLVETQTLDSIIDYQLSAIQLQNGTGSDVAQAHSWIDFFDKHDMHIMQLLAHRRLAEYHRTQEEYNQAAKLLTNGLELSMQFDYPFIAEQIKNAHGYLLYSRGELKEARETFQSLRQGTLSKYLMSTVLENITLTYYDEKEYDASVQFLGQAIEYSQKYDILSQIPDECLFMGDMYREKLQNPEMATHYYEIGSTVALRIAEYGFSLRGDRLDVVKRFENRPKVGYSLPEPVKVLSEPFAFALDQTWKQINDLFQFQLLRTHIESGYNLSELPAKLDLKTSTYYAIKRRLNYQGYDFESVTPNLPHIPGKRDLSGLKSYVHGLTDLSWSEANQQFEKEIIEYLFKQVGYRKTKLAEKLDVSYPTVLQKTKSLKGA